MKNKYRNIFLAFGIIAVLIMIFTFDMDYRELWVNLKRAGIYLPLVLLLWLFVYLINTLSWYIIIRSGGKPGFSFSRRAHGRRALSDYGAETLYRNRKGYLFGDSLRDDAHLLPLLFLADFRPVVCLSLSRRVGHERYSGSYHFILPAGYRPFYKRLPARYGSCLYPHG